jgi:hypothetical protein
MLHDTGERPRVKCLDKQRADPAHKSSEVAVDNPRGVGGEEMAPFVTASHDLQPRGIAVRRP